MAMERYKHNNFQNITINIRFQCNFLDNDIVNIMDHFFKTNDIIYMKGTYFINFTYYDSTTYLPKLHAATIKNRLDGRNTIPRNIYYYIDTCNIGIYIVIYKITNMNPLDTPLGALIRKRKSDYSEGDNKRSRPLNFAEENRRDKFCYLSGAPSEQTRQDTAEAMATSFLQTLQSGNQGSSSSTTSSSTTSSSDQQDPTSSSLQQDPTSLSVQQDLTSPSVQQDSSVQQDPSLSVQQDTTSSSEKPHVDISSNELPGSSSIVTPKAKQVGNLDFEMIKRIIMLPTTVENMMMMIKTIPSLQKKGDDDQVKFAMIQSFVGSNLPIEDRANMIQLLL